ncbi:uncharacterized protein BYT42DRAFT_561032 [Radiomyces spectabilis]|uniref:uncharacterized protein n=1 Tax=Radiomyces spectabilis TaxID=64574 RepID=UPI00221FCFBE|nr:uncharacterized protein BYT42DRAFT_561032 [Radiomyces spectabilis]KAI8388730.1 hypothetical protein BYT42DRAFT_561032 [Radiomyces spectabilis]
MPPSPRHQRMPTFIQFDLNDLPTINSNDVSDAQFPANKTIKRKAKDDNKAGEKPKKIKRTGRRRYVPPIPYSCNVWIGAAIQPARRAAFTLYYGENDERNCVRTFSISRPIEDFDYAQIMGALYALQATDKQTSLRIFTGCRDLPNVVLMGEDGLYHYSHLCDMLKENIKEREAATTLVQCSGRSAQIERKIADEMANAQLLASEPDTMQNSSSRKTTTSFAVKSAQRSDSEAEVEHSSEATTTTAHLVTQTTIEHDPLLISILESAKQERPKPSKQKQNINTVSETDTVTKATDKRASAVSKNIANPQEYIDSSSAAVTKRTASRIEVEVDNGQEQQEREIEVFEDAEQEFGIDSYDEPRNAQQGKEHPQEHESQQTTWGSSLWNMLQAPFSFFRRQ